MGSIGSLSIKNDKIVLKENQVYWSDIEQSCNNKTKIKIIWFSKYNKKHLI